MNNSSPANSTTPIIYPDFGVCWLEQLNQGLEWSQIVGCLLVLYCFSFSTMKKIWVILVVNAVTGFVSITIETFFSALHCTGNTNPNLAYMIAFNEINLITFEASTVAYSYMKTIVVVTSASLRKKLNTAMVLLFMCFAGCRINIGRLRFRENILMDPVIAEAHGYAYIFWVLADLMVFGLLCFNMREVLFKEGRNTTEGIAKIILRSSIPRIAIISGNTFMIGVVGQFTNPSIGLASFSTFIWMVKGVYPILMLIDVLITKDLLIQVMTTGTTSREIEMTNNNNNNNNNNNINVNVNSKSLSGSYGVNGVRSDNVRSEQEKNISVHLC